MCSIDQGLIQKSIPSAGWFTTKTDRKQHFYRTPAQPILFSDVFAQMGTNGPFVILLYCVFVHL